MSRFTAQLCKVNEELGLVFGWAIVSDINGVEYYDAHKEHIPQEVMLRDSAVFMEKYRTHKEMHSGPETGKVVFAFPLTKDIKTALGLQGDKTGLIVGVKPTERVLQKFKSGEYTGFSIGGTIEDWLDD